MQTLTLIFLITLIVVTLICAFLFFHIMGLRERNREEDVDAQSGIIDHVTQIEKVISDKHHSNIRMLLQQITELSDRVDTKLSRSSEQVVSSLQKQSSHHMNVIQELTEKMTRFDETNKNIMGFAEQLQSLQDILKNPKQRGILGEYYLETTLKNVLPPRSYAMQYAFPDGSIVDAVVHVRDKMIPIDSKFSLENYNRILDAKDPSERERLEKAFKNDLKLRIDETSKYILPEHGTLDFAFMFIPHEAIYYDLLVNEIGAMKVNTQDLIEYAFSKNVLIVSPTSFLAFLQTVLHGLKALQIEEHAKEIQKRVGELARHLSAYESYHDKLGKNLSTVVNHYNAGSKEFKKIEKDVTRITGENSTLVLDIDAVSKPEVVV